MGNDASAALKWYARPTAWLKDLYEWVLHWAETPYGVPALFLIAFAESSFFPIPPDVLLIALCVSIPKRAFRFALVCSAGSVLGGMAGYAIGWGAWELVQGFFFDYIPGFTRDRFLQVQQRYADNAFLAIFSAAFTPIPYKIFTIAAGVFDIDFTTLVLASGLGRPMRFFGVATVFFFFGPPVKRLIDKYFEWITLAFMVLLIGGFVAVKYAM